jgi:phosphoribosylaminoimidazole (AIR) synthetase
MPEKKARPGSSFDDFLAEAGILKTCEEQALKQILADQIKAAMEMDRLTKSAMAGRMRTSRRALDRLLVPKSTGVGTKARSAAATAPPARPRARRGG